MLGAEKKKPRIGRDIKRRLFQSVILKIHTVSITQISSHAKPFPVGRVLRTRRPVQTPTALQIARRSPLKKFFYLTRPSPPAPPKPQGPNNRKNCCPPVVGFVTVFIPLTTTGPGETAVHNPGAPRFVVACKTNPATFVGHVKTIPLPAPEFAATNNTGGDATSTGENTAVLSPAFPWLKSIPLTYATDSPEGEVVIAAGVEPLTNVNVAEAPAASAVPEPFTHLIEFPLTVFPHPNELLAPVGTDGRLLPPVVHPYQKLFKATVPVFVSVIV